METKYQDYINSLKGTAGVLTSVGVLIPAFSFFTTYAPPFFPAASLITAAIAVAVLLLVFFYEPSGNSIEDVGKKLAWKAGTALAAAVILLIVYMIMLVVCSVVDPPENPTERYQIGFWTFNWSLNADGLYLKQRHPNASPWELMDYGVAFSKEGPAKIWKFWTILVSGLSMILLFLFTFVLWVLGWALLAKRKTLGGNRLGSAPGAVGPNRI
jgi:hypothetical protein